MRAAPAMMHLGCTAWIFVKGDATTFATLY